MACALCQLAADHLPLRYQCSFSKHGLRKELEGMGAVLPLERKATRSLSEGRGVRS